MTSVFNEYAEYYDLIYQDKEYEKESAYVEGLINTHGNNTSTLLDLGCGTGGHVFEFARKKYVTTGIDVSTQMIDCANQKRDKLPDDIIQRTHFVAGDIVKFKLDKKFDVITALFHVISYITSTKELNDAISNAKSHLVTNGLLIFDFWYAPAVLHQKPGNVQKNFSNHKYSVTRDVCSEMIAEEKVVEVNIKLEIVEHGSNKMKNIIETHRMRYYNVSDFEKVLSDNGFRIKDMGEWRTGHEPGVNTWSVYIVAELL